MNNFIKDKLKMLLLLANRIALFFSVFTNLKKINNKLILNKKDLVFQYGMEFARL